jgi:molybdate transport system substrate-binding protein
VTWMRRPIVLLMTLALAIGAYCEELAIAAASDLNFALKQIAARYEHDTGNRLNISFGSSGNFYTQIRNGAPFDVFLSADTEFPRKLEAEGFAEPGTMVAYATGRLVLWVPGNSKLDLSRGMNVLLDPTIKKIAIANPAHAPYGRAAEAALKKAGVYEKVKDKIVIGENVSQAAQFVETGNADVGVIAASLSAAPTMKSRGRSYEVPEKLYAPLNQAAIVLKRSQRRSTAQQFLTYLKRPDIQDLLRQYGFSIATPKQ